MKATSKVPAPKPAPTKTPPKAPPGSPGGHERRSVEQRLARKKAESALNAAWTDACIGPQKKPLSEQDAAAARRGGFC